MSTNPFEDSDADYRVLINDEGQYSLWPLFAPAPPGWQVVSEGKRTACLEYVAAHWVDMRPRSITSSS